MMMAEDLEFIIELEYDPIKNSELGNIASKIKNTNGESMNSSPVLDDPVPASIEIGSKTGKTSYLSLAPTTIQSVRPNQTLFVWRAAFHPSIGRRFQSAIISLKFSDIYPTQYHLEIINHAPRKAFGGVTRESRKASWGLELPFMVTGGIVGPGIGVTPSAAIDISKDVEHAFTITGTRRGRPYKTSCIWTIEENSSSERGIPSEIQFATLVNHQSLVQCEVNVSAWTAGGILPPHYLKARTSPDKSKRVIDPDKYAGLLHEYTFGSDILDCESMLASWTGAVEGSILEFGQSSLRP